LEPLVARELEQLRIAPNVDTGGVSFRGTIETIGRANLWLRTASRVIVRIAAFKAQAFHELERLARAIPWERFVASGRAVRFRVTSRKSRLYHTGAIAQRLGEAVAHRLGPTVAIQPAGAEDDDEAAPVDAQLFVIRVFHDAFMVSADSSGALLHQRGYRKAIAKAPLRETLGAAMLIASDWTGSAQLLDPFCGSGTIPIEGALLARRIAPGIGRSFAFQSWPSFDASKWEKVLSEAADAALFRAPIGIFGSDRDAGAIQAALSNAERAGVSADVDFSVRALSAIEDRSDERGQVVTNPPYGVRVGEADRVRDLYARLGQVLRMKCPGWGLTLLSASPRNDREVRLHLEERARTRNGGIPVRILTATIPERVESSAG
jgi:putative N6-adenine-specific DNA methylase